MRTIIHLTEHGPKIVPIREFQSPFPGWAAATALEHARKAAAFRSEGLTHSAERQEHRVIVLARQLESYLRRHGGAACPP